MPYQWLFNPMIERTAIGYIIETLGNVIKMSKIPPTITVSVCYNISSWAIDFRVEQILECRKCNILAITQALVLALIVLCQIYKHSPLGVVCVYIRQSTIACVITLHAYINAYIHTYHIRWNFCGMKFLLNSN